MTTIPDTTIDSAWIPKTSFTDDSSDDRVLIASEPVLFRLTKKLNILFATAVLLPSISPSVIPTYPSLVMSFDPLPRIMCAPCISSAALLISKCVQPLMFRSACRGR